MGWLYSADATYGCERSEGGKTEGRVWLLGMFSPKGKRKPSLANHPHCSPNFALYAYGILLIPKQPTVAQETNSFPAIVPGRDNSAATS